MMSVPDDEQTSSDRERFRTVIETENPKEIFAEIFQNIRGKGVLKIDIEIVAEQGFEKKPSQVVTDYRTPINFQKSSNTFEAARLLHENTTDGEWTSVDDVHGWCGDDGDKEVTSSVLYDLADRGVVEKKSHPEDGRKNLYRLTEAGRQAVREELDS